jgi:putative FmdB family regulatory protein
MPLYEYHCPNCEGTFDKLVRFSEADKMPVCPNCGETETRKKISAGALIGSSPSRQAGDSRPASSPFT